MSIYEDYVQREQAHARGVKHHTMSAFQESAHGILELFHNRERARARAQAPHETWLSGLQQQDTTPEFDVINPKPQTINPKPISELHVPQHSKRWRWRRIQYDT